MNIFNNPYKSSFTASLISVIICVFLILLCAVLITYTDLSEDYLPVMAQVILYSSVFAGGFFSALGKSSGGLVRGLICGLYFSIYLCLTAIFMPGFKVSLWFLLKLLFVTLSSCAGGVLSVNISYKKHR